MTTNRSYLLGFLGLVAIIALSLLGYYWFDPVGCSRMLLGTPPAPGPVSEEAVFVAGGTYWMGCSGDPSCLPSEGPARRVTVSDFVMQRYEVTNDSFAAFLNALGNQEVWGSTWYDLESHQAGIINEQGHFRPRMGFGNRAVVEVSHHGARAYAHWKAARTGYAWRLPSEAEWEYAARGGRLMTPTLYAGSDDPTEVAWFNEQLEAATHAVGKKLPNELGLYDMSGNAWEWCADAWSDDYLGAPTDGTPRPLGSAGDRYTLRGGGRVGSEWGCRVYRRVAARAVVRNPITGFRLVYSVSDKP